jgi:hypothetical protein
VHEALATAISEMQYCAAAMRKVFSDHQIHDFSSIHVHYGCSLMLDSSMNRLQ